MNSNCNFVIGINNVSNYYYLSVSGGNNSTQVPDCVRWRSEGGGIGRRGLQSLFAVSVLPPSFHSPNDVCSNPAGLVLGLDQRIQ